MSQQEAAPAFREASGERRVQALPLSHVSIELGHLYFEDFAADQQSLVDLFRQVAPWAEAARAIHAGAVGAGRARISTCFLVDDYFAPSSSPRDVLPRLLDAVRGAGLQVDYLAREAGCADADGVPLARLVEERIVADPAPGTTGTRPPVNEAGWLCNGQRSPVNHQPEAMGAVSTWAPPVQNAVTRHSVFVDVELWSEQDSHTRTWSCAYLATVWQLLRLGLLRHLGEAVGAPQPYPRELPDQWSELPAVMQLNPKAPPFFAYRTVSVLGSRFLATEHAVRTIMGQVSIEDAVARQIQDRADREGIALPAEPVDRIGYVFAG